MNTLPRAITAQFLPDHTAYQNLRRYWSELMSSTRKRELTAAHHLIYLTLLGKDWRKGFTCITNPRKLDNGGFYAWGLARALAALHMPSQEAELLAPFGGVVTQAMLQHIRRLVPARNIFRYEPRQFTNGNFPFEAYSVPASVEAAKAEDTNTNA